MAVDERDPNSPYKYTQVAAKAASLVELFDARFEEGLPGPVPYKVELSAPDGPSTAGGKQALQHIKLVPTGGGPAIVIGSADTNKQTAEIRTYEHIAALYAQRFKGARIPLDVTKYQDLSQGLATFFRGMRMAVSFSHLDGVVQHPASIHPPATGGERSWTAITVSILVGLVLLGGAFWFIFLRH